MMPLLTVLAARAVEACGTVTELGGSLTTLAAVEANPVAAHGCTGCVWTSMAVEKDRRGEKNNISNRGRDTWTLSSDVNMYSLEQWPVSIKALSPVC